MIAVDAMGGDFAPQAVVNGSYEAAKLGIEINLFGDKKQIIRFLELRDKDWQLLPIQVSHCDDFVSMKDQPTPALLKRINTSIVQALESVAKKKNAAFVSAGNSGAVLMAAIFISGKVSGIKRAAFGNFLPTKNGSIFFIDLGANADCRPEFLLDFARMGSAYVCLEKNNKKPKIALLSNGHEPYKGCAVVKQAYKLLEESKLNFVGNVEPDQILLGDKCDVVVSDGFAGNILLKTAQATAKTMSGWLAQEHNSSIFKRLAYILNIPVYKGLRKRMQQRSKGGALLLGVNDPVVIAHGNSDASVIKNAILFAYEKVQNKFLDRFNEKVAKVIY
jgi:phosphate acyltransferase